MNHHHHTQQQQQKAGEQQLSEPEDMEMEGEKLSERGRDGHFEASSVTILPPHEIRQLLLLGLKLNFTVNTEAYS